MSEEMQIDGKSYLSSKRAAELSGYAQDYIGQLARKSLIDAKRIGGLWYISMSSLEDYKKKADEYKPQPPVRPTTADLSTLIFFDGKEYLSAAKAAEQTGYTQDYVGQLARSGAILSRQVGNRWYVERTSITAHKAEKDRLLAMVQKDAVGLSPKRSEVSVSAGHSYPKPSTEQPIMTYFSESADLMPTHHESSEISKQSVVNEPISVDRDVQVIQPVAVPIKRLPPFKQAPRPTITKAPVFALPAPKRNSPILLLGAAATIVIVLSVGYASVLRQNSVFATKSTGVGAFTASVDEAFTSIGNVLEPYLTHDLVYERSDSK